MSCCEILSQKSSNSHKKSKNNPQDHATRSLESNAERDENRGTLTCNSRDTVLFICTHWGCWGGYFGLRGKGWQGSGENHVLRSFMTCGPTAHQKLFWWQNQAEWDRRGMWHAWQTREVCTGFWWEHLMKRFHLEELGVGGRKLLKLVIKKRKGGTDWISLA